MQTPSIPLCQARFRPLTGRPGKWRPGRLGILLGGWWLLAISSGEAYTFSCPNPPPEYQLVVVGDSRTDYHPAKMAVLEGILREKPQAVLHLGDMVASAEPALWEQFDREEGRILDQGTPILPLAGNHEYRPARWSWEHPLTPFFKRFTALQGNSWYEFLCGPLRLLALDSTEGLRPGGDQWSWLQRRLRPTEQPDGWVIVALHHPLITSYPNYRHRYATELLDLLLATPEQTSPTLILSSHVHNYEHFRRKGAHLLVSGGGGAPPYPLLRLPDDQYPGTEEPNFHYLRLTMTATRLQGEMMRWNTVTGRFEVADRWEEHRPPKP